MFKKFLHELKIQHLNLRGSCLYLAQIPLWLSIPISLFRGQIFKSIALVAVVACITYGANLTRRYYLQKRDELLNRSVRVIRDERRIAMGYISLGVFILCIAVTRRFFVIGVVAAALAALGYYLSYLAEPDTVPAEQPPEPKKNDYDHLSPTLRSMLTDAHGYIATILNAAILLDRSAEDEYITTRLRQVGRRSDALLDDLGKDSNRIREARTFLVVHLRELAEISQTYSQTGFAEKAQSRQQFRTLLDTIHAQLNAHHEAISEAERQRLAIQMDVLQEQLENRHQDE